MALEHVCVVPWFDGVLEAAGELEELGIVLEHPPEQRSQLANGIQLRHLKVVVVPCTASWACQSPAARSIFACMHICMYAFIRGSFCPGYNMTGRNRPLRVRFCARAACGGARVGGSTHQIYVTQMDQAAAEVKAF